MSKPITPTNMEKLGLEVANWLLQFGMFHDVNIYVANACVTDTKSDKHDCTTMELVNGTVYIIRNIKPEIEYANPDTITMTFEGPLYHALNHDGGRTYDRLQKMFGKYGLYFEQGYAWSLAGYPLD